MTINVPDRWHSDALELLNDMHEGLEGQVDVNWEGDGPNTAMRFQMQIDELLRTERFHRRQT